MEFFARIESPLGAILIRSDGTMLSGLFFTDQKDCPRLQGLTHPALRDPDPTAGTRAGIPIRRFKLRRQCAQAELFESSSSAQGGGSAGRQGDVKDPGRGTEGVACEIAVLQEQTPSDALRIFEQTRAELDEYFAGVRQVFSVPLALQGTEFQKRVWAALLAIPYGEYVSYADVAVSAGLSPKHGRPVGTAVGRNPVAIIVPCHRVLSSAGMLNGYTGGLDRKLALLEVEGYVLG